MNVGGTYERGEDKCSVHGGYEMWHTCGGSEGEPLGYCSAWDGTLIGSHVGKDGVTMYGGYPDCRFYGDNDAT